MTYADNSVRKYAQGYGFLSFTKKFETKYGKKFVKKGFTAAKRFKTGAKKFNKSDYGKAFKKEESKFVKTSKKRTLEKAAPAVGDFIGSKIADKITSLDNKPEEQQEEQKIIIPPERGQQIIDDLRLF